MALPSDPSARAVSTSTPARPGTSKSFVDVAVEKKFCTAEQIVLAMAEFQRENPGSGPGETLASFLVRKNVLSHEQIKECERWLRAPKVIGGFELANKIGQGGMGSVFRARQLSMDRDVALKILPPSLAQDPTFKERFLHEAQLSAKFNHLNIISGIDCGEDKGLTFFAMELVEGKTLKEILKAKGKLDVAEAADAVLQIAGALVYAESHKLVHRDIKPDNIMLTTANVAKLCDLGLAKLTTAAGDSFQTQAGTTVGTPHYISPEQTRGEASVDTRSDIYSLGATFYHLLTGTTPFNAPTSASVMALHLTDTAPNPCDIDHAIPIAYGQILSKMMAKDAADRYRHASDLVKDLELARDHKAPAAAQFHAKSSCSQPIRKSKTTTTGPRAPVLLERREQAPILRPGSILGWIVAAAAFGGGAFAVWKFMIDAPPADSPVAVRTPVENTNKEASAGGMEPVAPADAPKVRPEVKSALVSPSQMESSIAKSVTPPATTSSKKPPETAVVPSVVTEMKSPAAVPTVPAAPARAAITARAVAARKVDPPPGKAEVTPEIVYARFLKEAAQLNSRDLNKLKNEIGVLAAKSEYRLSKENCAGAVKDVELAIEYETNALKAIAAAGGMVDLNEEAAKKFGAKQGKISGFDPARGLSVVVGPVTISLNAGQLPLSHVLKSSPDGTALAQVRYRTIKGDLEGARALLKALKGAELERWETRLRLQTESAEFELMAAEEFKVLEAEHARKHWQNVLKLAPEFEKTFASTEAFKASAAKLAEWKKDAMSALSPPEGLETSGKWEPLKLPLFNACIASIQSEPEFGTKFIRTTCNAAEGLGKAAVVRTASVTLDQAAVGELRFAVRNLGASALKLAVVLVREEKIFESPQVDVPPASQQEVALWLKCQAFKQVMIPDPSYNKALPPGFQPEKIVFVFYTAAGFTADIDGVVLK